MATLTNRVDEAERNIIIVAIGERIALITPDDVWALQIENARAEADFWDALKASQDDQHGRQKALVAKLKRDLPESRNAQVLIAAQAKAAKSRLTKAKRGTLAGGLTKLDVTKMLGWKPSELRHCRRIYEIHKIGADQELMDEIMKRHRSGEVAAARTVINKRKTS